MARKLPAVKISGSSVRVLTFLINAVPDIFLW
jgi:hypothetical protein